MILCITEHSVEEYQGPHAFCFSPLKIRLTDG